MFTVKIVGLPVKLTGTAAINWYRARGLTEFSDVNYDGLTWLQRLDVHSAFARVWFPKNAQEVVIRIDLDDYGREEIVDDKGRFFLGDRIGDYHTFKLRLKTEQVQWLVMRNYIDGVAQCQVPKPPR